MKKLILPILLSTVAVTQCSLEDRCAKVATNIAEIKSAIKAGTLETKSKCARNCKNACKSANT